MVSEVALIAKSFSSFVWHWSLIETVSSYCWEERGREREREREGEREERRRRSGVEEPPQPPQVCL